MYFLKFLSNFTEKKNPTRNDALNMPSNSLPDGDLTLQEMKTKSPTCPAEGYLTYIIFVKQGSGMGGPSRWTEMNPPKINVKCENL